MWMMLQRKKPEDFVLATGKQYTIKQFINYASKELKMKIHWKGKGLEEKAYNSKGEMIIGLDKRYFRPLEVDTLLGDYSKAKKILKWKPKTTLSNLIKDMINSELNS